jgi:hypothetical protein
MARRIKGRAVPKAGLTVKATAEMVEEMTAQTMGEATMEGVKTEREMEVG